MLSLIEALPVVVAIAPAAARIHEAAREHERK
jgi:hypothetical protein